jgi:tryptophan synthase alpha chain
MEPIRATFDRLRRAQRTALIPFFVGGDSEGATTASLLLRFEDAGADLIEVGIPCSDPLADGPVIQAASARALAHGATPARVLSAIASVRHRLQAPVICLSYWNPLLQFRQRTSGSRTSGILPDPTPFVHAAHASGVAGVIVPDLPLEESALLRRVTRRAGPATILLAAPTSPLERLRAIARASEGFIYYVSVIGTTGARKHLPDGLIEGVRRLKRLTTTPVCVGFGISTPAQAAHVAAIEGADGVIVGSALVQTLSDGTSRAAGARRAEQLIARFRRAIS